MPASIDAIEKRGVWTCQRNSGIGIAPLLDWRQRGWLTEGRDYRRVRVSVGAGWHRRSTREVTFYRRARLNTLSRRDGRARTNEAIRQQRRDTERRTICGVEHLRSSFAAAFLGVSQPTLREIPGLGAIKEIVFGRETLYYPAPNLARERNVEPNGTHSQKPRVPANH